MRRKEKAMTNQKEVFEILTSEKICHIALSDGTIPYIVPVNYGYKDNALYIHSAKTGRKIEMIKKNNAICFEIESDVQIVQSDTACKWTTHYTSIIGYGKAELLSEREAVKEALDIIMRQQSGRNGWKYSEEGLKKVVIIKIKIDSISRKYSG